MHPTILWVCGRHDKALERRHQMGDPPGIHFIVAGSALVGRGFDEIILDDWHPETKQDWHWVRHTLWTRLNMAHTYDDTIKTLAPLERPPKDPI